MTRSIPTPPISYLVAVLAWCGAPLQSAPLLANEGKVRAGPPPLAYRLDALSLRLLRQPGHGQAILALTMSGNGTATLESGRTPSKHAFSIASSDLVALVNGLHGLRFFDLPAVLGPRASVFLLADGSLGTQSLTLMDATTTTVCFALPGYEKCVRYVAGQGPRELEIWVDALLTDVARRVPAAGAGK